MTLIDLACLPAGVGAVALWRMGAPWSVPADGTELRIYVLFWIATVAIPGVYVATSAAILIRRFAYGGMPRAGEWLVIFFAMGFVQSLPPSISVVVEETIARTRDIGSFAAAE